MSLNLYAEPMKPPEGTCLGGHPIKGLLCDAYGEYDGSIKEDFLLSQANVRELRVLQRVSQDPEVTDSLQEVIDLIEKHGVIRVWTDE